MHGFVEHEIACAVIDNEWVDLVHWSDAGAAACAERLFRRDPAAASLLAVVTQQWITPLYLEDLTAERHMAYAY
jgi:hypothetical protein